jgi:hypothetical protein
MPHSFLIFDFGVNEEAAQQARHRIEGWRQGYRLDKKMQLKFERKELEAKPDTASAPSSKQAKPNAKSKDAGDADEESRSSLAAQSEICLIVRLDFSDHEKLSHRRWLEHIPSEDPFKAAKPKIVRSGDPEFAATAERFDSLHHAPRSERTGLKV